MLLNGSVGKGECCHARCLELSARDSDGGRTESTSKNSSLFPHAHCGDLKLLVNLLAPLRCWNYRLGAYHPAWFRWYWSHGLWHSKPTFSLLSYISSCLNRSTWSSFVFLFQDPNRRKTCCECLSRILEPSFLGKDLRNGSPLSPTDPLSPILVVLVFSLPHTSLFWEYL